MPETIVFDAVTNFHQPEKAYRFSTDSILLANFVNLSGVKRAADLGAGCGVVGLAALENLKRKAKLGDDSPLSKGRPPPQAGPCSAAPELFYFVERQPVMLESLAKNVALYQPRTSCRLEILAGDWRDLFPEDLGGRLDCIMVNPPYFTASSGRPSSRPSVDAARREIFGGLEELLASISRLLASPGWAALILPSSRRREMEKLSARYGLAVKTVSPAANSSPCPLIWLLSK